MSDDRFIVFDQGGINVQELVEAVEKASTLTLMILGAWQLARVLAVKIVQEVLTERAQRPTQWSSCPQCGARLNRSRETWSTIGTLCQASERAGTRALAGGCASPR